MNEKLKKNLDLDFPKMGKCFTTIFGQSNWLRHSH